MVRNRRGPDSVLLLRNHLAGNSGHDHKRESSPARPVCPAFCRGLSGKPSCREEYDLRERRSRRGVELRSHSQGAFRWHLRNWHSRKPARLRGVSIRPGEATSYRSPNLLRRHDIAQANFITPAPGADESPYIVVCGALLSPVRERARICPFALIH